MAVHLIGSLLLKTPVGASLQLISWGHGETCSEWQVRYTKDQARRMEKD